MKRLVAFLFYLLLVPSLFAQVGPRDVMVTTDSGNFTLPNGFSVSAAAPVIASLSPAGANRGQTVAVTISGSNLAGSTAVTFSGIGVTGSVVSSTFASVVANVTVSGTAALGNRNVSITGPGGVSNTLTGAFLVRQPAPTITSVTPVSGVQGATLDVVVVGTNLLNSDGTLPQFNFGPGITATPKAGGTATSITVTLTIQGPMAYAPCLDTPLYKQRSPTVWTAGCLGIFGYYTIGMGPTEAAALIDAMYKSSLPMRPPVSA